MQQSGSGYEHPSQVREEATNLYRNGYNEGDIVTGLQQRGGAWGKVSRSTVNRWLVAARELDPDLVIRHHLNLRKRKPGVYTDWKAVGTIILGPFYDPLTDTLYLGPGISFYPLPGSREPMNVVKYGAEQEKRWREKFEQFFEKARPVPYSEMVISYLVQLHDIFGYSYRDIAKLSKGEPTRFPDKDKLEIVQHAASQLKPTSYSTVRRMIQEYSEGVKDRRSGVIKQISTQHVVFPVPQASKQVEQ